MWDLSGLASRQAAEQYRFDQSIDAVGFCKTGDTMLIAAGQWHYLAFNQVKRLEEQNGVLTIAERIEEGLWEEGDCANTSNLADVLDCIKYYRSQSKFHSTYITNALNSVEKKLKQEKTAKLLQIRSDLVYYLQLNERDTRAKFVRDSVLKVEKIKADSIERVEQIKADSIFRAEKPRRDLEDRLKTIERGLAQLKETPGDSVLLANLAQTYGNLAWSYLITRQPIQAIEAAQKGLAAYPRKTWINCHLALGYLYNGEWAKAESIYKTWMDVDWKTSGSSSSRDYKTFRDVFKGDLNHNDIKALVHPDVAKARALLEGKKQ